MNRRELGEFGENKAIEYLKIEGYSIVDRNYRCRKGEIDLVVRDGNCLIFVEVKTRKDTQFGRPCESIDWKKRQHIRAVAACYIKEKKPKDQLYRFDCMEVVYSHIEGIF